MPTITKTKYLDLLRAKLAAEPDVTAAELNAPTKAGETIGTVEIGQATAVLSDGTLAAIEAAATTAASASPADEARRVAASAWYSRTSAGQIDLAEGTEWRATVNALVEAGLMTAAERAALIALATTDVPGPSWAEAVGLGYVYAENIAQAQEVDS